VGALAPSIGWLIGARALLGIGGALMWPAILGMTYAALPPQKASLAGGLIIGAAGIGQALGPITGGILTELWGWRWILWLNVPICILAILITWREVHQPAEPSAGQRIDYAGIATLSIGLVALLFALDQATDWGWGDWRILLSLVASAVLLVVFWFVERRAGLDALVPSDVMRSRQFAAACVSIGLIAPAFFAALLYPPQFMQKFLGYTPIQAGLGMLPMMAVFAAVSFGAAQLYERFGARLTVAVGAAGFALGPLLLSLVTPNSDYPALVPGMAVLGVGLGLFAPSVTTAGVTAVDPSRTSLAGGLIYMFQIAGGSVGLGLTTTVFMMSAQSKLAADLAALGTPLTAAQQNAMHSLLAGTESAQQVLQQFGPDVAGRITALVRDAFVAGFQNGFRLDAALGLLALIVAVLYIRGAPRGTAPATDNIPPRGD
jgi:EmrB/QacA subfamily drug resistance transporter